MTEKTESEIAEEKAEKAADKLEKAEREAIEERAYINVDPHGILLVPFEPTVKGHAHVGFSNKGKRRATGVSWTLDAVISKDRNFNVISAINKVGGAVIHPGCDMRQSVDFEFSVEDVAAFKAEKAYVYVYGRVEYTDGFNEHRYTDFCHRYEAKGMASTKGTILYPNTFAVYVEGARYHEFGNDAS